MPTNKIIESFREKFGAINCTPIHAIPAIEQFILTAIKQDREELVGKLEGMRINYSQAEKMSENCLTDKSGYCKFGYNQAIQDILNIIQEQ